MADKRFNLIDEPWIPVVDEGRVSLRAIFTQPHLKALGGNPVQKIAVTKLLLAIAQSACTPEEDQAWATLGAEGLSQACLAYLEKWHDRFYLYGDRPFLQMPAIKQAEIKPYGAVLPEIATGNTTVHTQIQQEKSLDDADKALLILQLMGFGLGGKKTDNTIVLTAGYQGKTKENGKAVTGKPGTSIGFMGFLHNFLLGKNLQTTIWLNLFTQDNIRQMKTFEAGLGRPPWEEMPTGEDDAIAQKLKRSLMGRLIPLSRFVLLREDGLHYSEGISHPSYKEGVADPSVSVNYSGKTPKVIWVDPEKRPWRMLTALLSFISSQTKEVFTCPQLEFCLPRAVKQVEQLAIWSGGLRVSSNAGEQYVSGSDDFVESTIWIPTDMIGEGWFEHLQVEMKALETLAKKLYGSVMSYYKLQLVDGKLQAEQATSLFWQLAESRFQALVDGADDTLQRSALRKTFANFVYQVFDLFCPKETVRQLDAWVQARPNLSQYLAQAQTVNTQPFQLNPVG